MIMPIGINSRASSFMPAPSRLLTTPIGSVAGLSLSFCKAPTDIIDEWLEFEKSACATLFQSYKWLSAWCRTAALAHGEHPLILTGFDADGRLALIWPMAIVKKLGTFVLTWLGQARSNYNFGLYRRDIIDQIGEAEIRAILGKISRQRPEIGAIHFLKQPFEWNGVKNPLAQLPTYPAALRAYALNLYPDFDSLYASTFSARSRSTLRRKERNLAKSGKLNISLAATETERLELLETFLRQKAIQFQSQGELNVFEDPSMQTFYRELARDTGNGTSFECAYLSLDNTVAATFNGMRFQDIFYFLTASMDLGELKRWSPGFILMREHVAHHCRQKTAVFDLGPGDGDHKASWQGQEVRCFETHLSLSPRGWATTALSQTKAKSKFAIKRNPILWKTARSVRGLTRALRRHIISEPNNS
ncbi:MAG: GNAT family N-acetyltransferase [Hyphomicrobiaceae bacterium]